MMEATDSKQFLLKGYLLAAIGAGAFGLQGLFVRHMSGYGIGSWMTAFSRNGIMAIGFLLICLVKGEDFRIGLKELLQIIFLGLNGTVFGSALLYMSYDYMDTGLCTTLNFTYPVIIFLLSALFYHEKIDRIYWAALGVSFLGILLLCRPGGDFSWIGAALSIGAGVTYAVYLLYLDKSHIMDRMNYNVFSLYYFTGAGIALALFAICNGEFRLAYPLPAYGWTALYVIDSGIFAVVCLQKGIQIIGSVKASILGAMEPLTSVAAGILFLGESMNLSEAVGCVLVICGTILVVRRPKSA